MKRRGRFGSALTGDGLVWTPRGKAAWLVAAWCGMLATCAGCKQEAGTKSEVLLPVIGRESAEDVARGVIETMRVELGAMSVRDMAAVLAARKHLMTVAAADVIASRYPKDLSATREQMLDAAVESWGKIVAYYADGLNLDGLSRVDRSDGAADVFVPYVGSRGGAKGSVTLRIECRQSAGVWSVARLDFAPLPAASQPASSPT